MLKPTVWVHSQSNRSLGQFLVFLAIALALPARALLEAAEIPGPPALLWTLLPGLLAVAGWSMISLSRKRFWARPGWLEIREGFARQSRRFGWEGPADIVLTSYEDGRAEWWIVELACGKPHFPLHRCRGEAAQARHLATALARSIGGSLIENETTVITAAELDLSLPERLHLHPQLLGEAVACPDSCRVLAQEGPDGLIFHWKHPFRLVLPFFLGLSVLILLLASVPLFPGDFPDSYSEWRGAKFQRSAWQQLERGDDSYFRLCGLFLVLATAVWAGVRQELCFNSVGARRATSLLGLRLSSFQMPVSQIREIWARPLQYGCDFEVVGEERQIGGWMAQPEAARWIVSRALRFYADRH